jgi:hypothetical protein
LIRTAFCLTGYNYELDTEYSGADFFNGWEFFTVRIPLNAAYGGTLLIHVGW